MSRAYYNEIDPAAAHILRAMIDANVIAPGDVDTRSIKDVQPNDVAGYTQAHFFAGGGLWSVAARLAGWPDDLPLWTGSCPCQPFSAAGKGLGTDDPRHLWPDFHRLISARRPAVVMGEQVAGKAGYGWFDGVRSDLAGEGYAGRAVDFPACSVDAPHQRNRLYWCAVSVADCNSGGPSSIRRDVGEVCRLSEAQRGTEYDASLFGRGDGAPFQRVSSARKGGHVASHDGERCAEAVREPGYRPSPHQQGAADWPEHVHCDGGGVLSDADRGRRAGRTEGAERVAFERAPSKRPMLRNGTYWSDAQWIACHDEKARRAKSGIRFLVDGLPGRVDLWRVGGNAIVPEAAAEVIAAFMDVYGVPVLQQEAA